VLARAPREGGESFGIAVARAPGGGYLAGTCRTSQPELMKLNIRSADPRGYVVPAPAGGPDRLLAGVLLEPGYEADGVRTPAKVLVVTPRDATEVRYGGTTVPVHDRLAIVTLPDRATAEVFEATVHDAGGTSLGTARIAPSEQDVEQVSFYGVDGMGKPYRP
jgi:hypothetical protein